MNEPKPRTRTLALLKEIGDLDHPYYHDERQRHVCYEASAISLQIALMLSYAIAGVLLLAAGSSAAAYVLPMVLPAFIAGAVTTWYTRYYKAGYEPVRSDFQGRRGRLVVFVMALLAAGLIRLFFDVGIF